MRNVFYILLVFFALILDCFSQSIIIDGDKIIYTNTVTWTNGAKLNLQTGSKLQKDGVTLPGNSVLIVDNTSGNVVGTNVLSTLLGGTGNTNGGIYVTNGQESVNLGTNLTVNGILVVTNPVAGTISSTDTQNWNDAFNHTSKVGSLAHGLGNLSLQNSNGINVIGGSLSNLTSLYVGNNAVLTNAPSGTIAAASPYGTNTATTWIEIRGSAVSAQTNQGGTATVYIAGGTPAAGGTNIWELWGTKIQNLGTSGGPGVTQAVDFALGSSARILITNSITINPSALSGIYTGYQVSARFEVQHDGTANTYTCGWANVRSPNGSRPSLSNATNSFDVFTLRWSGFGTNGASSTGFWMMDDSFGPMLDVVN